MFESKDIPVNFHNSPRWVIFSWRKVNGEPMCHVQTLFYFFGTLTVMPTAANDF